MGERRYANIFPASIIEGSHAPKPIWTMEKMTDEIKTKMMRQIIPFRYEISELHSTWKLGQNKPEQARLDAATALAEHVPALAKLMKDPPQ